MTPSKPTNTDRDMKTLEVREIFFDFEGTLVDFQWRVAEAVQETLDRLEALGFHRDTFGRNPTYATIFNRIHEMLEKEGGDQAAAAAALVDDIYDRYDADALSRWNLYPDTIQVLQALKNLGFRMGLVSNIGKKSLQAAMDRLGLTAFMEAVISRSDVTRQKPHAQGLIKAAEKLGVPPAQCILIGDSREDVGAARGAGMLAGHLKGGQHSTESMQQNPADLELDALADLPYLLKRSRR